MKLKKHLVIACVCALAARMSQVDAQERTRHETRSEVLEFEANGYPTDDTVRRIQEEIDYQRAVQAYNRLLKPNTDLAIDFHTGTAGLDAAALDIGAMRSPTPMPAFLASRLKLVWRVSWIRTRLLFSSKAR